MRVLWTHNFDKAVSPVAGVFVDIAYEALRTAGLEPTMLYLGNLRSPTRLWQARALVQANAGDFDIVHAQFGSAAALASVGHGVPCVVSLRGSDWTPAYSPRLRGKAHAAMATRMSRLAVPRSDGVVAVSERIARQVSERYPQVPVRVLPDPVDLTAFTPMDKRLARHRLGLREDGKYVLFTTVDIRNALKRPELAQRAVQLAAEKIPGLEMLVASGRPHEEMPLFAAAADVALTTSVSEGWPNCIKEALACDTPFVGTDVSDLARIAHRDPRCHVVEADAWVISDALVAVMRQPKSNKGLREHVRTMAPEAFAEGLTHFYEEVLVQSVQRRQM